MPASSNLSYKKTIDRIMTSIFYIGTIGAVLLLIAFIGFVIGQGLPYISFSTFSFTGSGLGNMFFNTIYLVFLALVCSAIAGIPAGIYLAEYARPGFILNWIRISIETLSSLPSIVVGLFGYLVFIVMTGSQWNLLAGALSVSILTLPLVTSVTEEALRNLPESFRQGSYGLGASHWQTIYHILLPACLPRIMTGLIMAAGRGFGEAAALMFTAGMSTDINWSNWDLASAQCPLNPMRPGETLALHIWALRTEALQANAAQIASATSAILMILVVSFSLLTRYISFKLDQKAGGIN